MTSAAPSTAAAAPAPGADLVPLREVALELQISALKLRRMSVSGQFPRCLVVTRKHWLVRRTDVEAWKHGRWTPLPPDAVPPTPRRRRRAAR